MVWDYKIYWLSVIDKQCLLVKLSDNLNSTFAYLCLQLGVYLPLPVFAYIFLWSLYIYYNLRLGSGYNLGKDLSWEVGKNQLVKHKDTRLYLQLYISIVLKENVQHWKKSRRKEKRLRGWRKTESLALRVNILVNASRIQR